MSIEPSLDIVNKHLKKIWAYKMNAQKINNIIKITVSKNEKTIILGFYGNNEIMVIDVKTKKTVSIVHDDNRITRIECISVSYDNNFFVTGSSQSSTFILWNMRTCEKIKSIKNIMIDFDDICIAPDNLTTLIANDKSLKKYDILTEKYYDMCDFNPINFFLDDNYLSITTSFVTFSNCGKFVTILVETILHKKNPDIYNAIIIKVSDGEIIYQQETQNIRSVSFSHDSKLLLTYCNADKIIEIYHIKKKCILATYKNYKGNIVNFVDNTW